MAIRFIPSPKARSAAGSASAAWVTPMSDPARVSMRSLDLARGLQPAAPDALGRDAEDQMVGPAGHHPVDRFLQRDVDAPDQLVEILVRVDRVVGDMHARDVIGHPLGRHRVVMRLHDGVGGRRDHTEFHPPAPSIDHPVPPQASRFKIFRASASRPHRVMAGLVPAIHATRRARHPVGRDARNKSGHDG